MNIATVPSLRRIVQITFAAMATIAALLVVGAPTASADDVVERNCGEDIGRMCLHYNSRDFGWNSEFGSNSQIQTMNGRLTPKVYLFTSGRKGHNGQGAFVWNNAGGAANWHRSIDFEVCYNSWYTGPCDTIPAWKYRNLTDTKNENTSMRWLYDE